MNEAHQIQEPVRFLKGHTALDLTDLKGQLCGRFLSDLGMEVIKIEPPGGDPVRTLQPLIEASDGKKLSLPFAHLNANKQSIVPSYLTSKNQQTGVTSNSSLAGPMSSSKALLQAF